MTLPVGHTTAVTDQPVTLVNAFSVPMSQKDRFLSRWKDNARCMTSAPGFIRARMLQAVNDKAELTFINVAEWESGTALDAARTNPEWQQTIQRMNDDPELDVTARPMVYRTAIDAGPGDPLR
ncbi:antibiotic biosynthesis monooxygenase family protein [Nocardia abscessus]|jgi:heme-degrading monooxygenase HmoA|uniref:antibiotic biosynthesis monooxygenase family protein n=1 Tax=Nocardia abscessus TaxID=120957 RepID=UPI0005B92F05|nr:antibiotic biosynthesis monooxygenase family protein [Nocardia abscessus]MCC3332093.1 antibiotic biosynthesis monooxygenase [Nocardia abscessus]